MADERIQYTEEMVGNGHPTKPDTLNRHANVEHNSDGTHKAAAVTSAGGILHSLATAANDFLVASGVGAYIKKTLAETRTILGVDQATTSATGVVELATDAEVIAGTDTSRVVTPAGLAAKIGVYDIHEVSEFPDDHTAAGLALLDDADAAAQRTTLGLGTIATQNANNVNISGGAVAGITDLAIADGGTGASTAANARSNLGVAIGVDVMAFEAYSIHEIEELCSVD